MRRETPLPYSFSEEKHEAIDCISIKYELVSAAKSIGYWPVNTEEHEKRALYKHLNRLFCSQVLCHEVLAPVPSDMLEKIRRGSKTWRLFNSPSI